VDDLAEIGSGCISVNGGCRAEGVYVCRDDALLCDAEVPSPSEERCNGVDDDCDGMTDEEEEGPLCPALPQASVACQEGTCTAACDPGFEDRNGDLSSPGSDGCECSVDDDEITCCALPWPFEVVANDELRFSDLVMAAFAGERYVLAAWRTSSGLAYVVVNAELEQVWERTVFFAEDVAQVRVAGSTLRAALSWFDLRRGRVSFQFVTAEGPLWIDAVHEVLTDLDGPPDFASLVFSEGILGMAWVPNECSDGNCVRFARTSGDPESAYVIEFPVDGEVRALATATTGDLAMAVAYAYTGVVEGVREIGTLTGWTWALSTGVMDTSNNDLDVMRREWPEITAISAGELWAMASTDWVSTGHCEVLAVLPNLTGLEELFPEESPTQTVLLAWDADDSSLRYLRHGEGEEPESVVVNHRRYRAEIREEGEIRLSEKQQARSVVTEEAVNSIGVAMLGGRLLVGTIPESGSSVRFTFLNEDGARVCP
jgi:hypothetical protein